MRISKDNHPHFIKAPKSLNNDRQKNKIHQKLIKDKSRAELDPTSGRWHRLIFIDFPFRSQEAPTELPFFQFNLEEFFNVICAAQLSFYTADLQQRSVVVSLLCQVFQ